MAASPLQRDQIVTIIELARDAGAAVMTMYGRSGSAVDARDPRGSTHADLAAHASLMVGLAKVTPGVPIVSEEASNQSDWSTRRGWDAYWLVDPLDGSQEFLRHNGEFTVNLGLVVDGRPVFGVVHAPVSDVTWWGGLDGGAWKQRHTGDGAGPPQRLHVAAPPDARGPWRFVASRSNATHRVQEFLRRLGWPHELVPLGSSLKLCRVAEGRAHAYARFGPTKTWSTAAGHAVLAAAGGDLVDAAGRSLGYGGESLENPWFIAHGPEVSAEVFEAWPPDDPLLRMPDESDTEAGGGDAAAARGASDGRDKGRIGGRPVPPAVPAVARRREAPAGGTVGA